ncbi:hypothetical protein TNCT_225971, partial [Trichonephila clavata]
KVVDKNRQLKYGTVSGCRCSLWQELGEPCFQMALDHNLPRVVGVEAFRVKTRHDFLAAHLHRINVLPSPESQLCGYGSMNAEHLRTCSALDRQKQHLQGQHVT